MRFGCIEILLIVGLILLIFGPKPFGLVSKSAKQGFKEFKNAETKENKNSSR